MQMSGSSKVEMSAFPAQCRDGWTPHVEHEGTGSPAGPDADRRAAADAPARGGAAPDRRAPGATPLSRVRPSPRRLPAATQERALALIRERYADFGPTFAHQKLTEEHALVLSVETLRGWMSAAGLWVPRAQRARRSYPPRERRACLGELVQLDGSEHAWFEDRGPRCTLLFYVDDATSRLMELCFADTESTFD